MTYGFVGLANLTHQVLSIGNLLLGYKVDEKTNLFLRTHQEHFRRKNPEGIKGWFDHIILDAITRYNEKTSVCAEVSHLLSRLL